MEFGRDVNFGCCCLSPKCSSILIGGICLVVCAVTTVLLCTELVALEYLENLHSVTKVKAEILNLMVFTGVLIFISLGGCCLAIALLLGVYKESTRLIFAWIVGTAASILVQFVAALVEVLGLEQPFRLYKFITMLDRSLSIRICNQTHAILSFVNIRCCVAHPRPSRRWTCYGGMSCLAYTYSL
ncbi:hypothetical protein J6590_008792 [Homalodisca vitripennis]|nr:hypothetical protein J6590_008792 [Homalodisca vitripennis]